MSDFNKGIDLYKNGNYYDAVQFFLSSIKSENETRILAYYNLALACRSGNEHNLAYIYFDWFLKMTEKVAGYKTLRDNARSFNKRYEVMFTLMPNTIASVMHGLTRIR